MKRPALVTVFALGLAVAGTAAIGGAAGTAIQDDAGANASFGAEVSSFMQASSVEVSGEVDDGMFAAALNRTDDPEERRDLIEEREAELQDRRAHLTARQRALNASNSSAVGRYAIATEVAVGAGELAESANRTRRAAAAAGLNTTALAELRANASDMHGRGVAEIARGLAGPPAGVGGPPAGVPGGGNDSADGQEPPGLGPGSDGSNASEADGDSGNDDGGTSDDGAGGPPGDDADVDDDDSADGSA